MTALLAIAAAVRADYPASSVRTQSVAPGQSYPGVDAHGEGWFDVGGFCKVVDVGDLSALAPGAHGVPVFIPGPATQWENYRTLAPSHYDGQLTLTTCCRPQANIATLCTEAGATPVAVSRDYGRNGETDVVTATCIDQWGRPYSDAVPVACIGDNSPDGQAQWIETSGDTPGNCTPDAYDTGCSAACDSTSTGTRYDSCGNPTSYTCSGGPCPPPPPPPTGPTGPTGPTYCAPGTVFSSCQLQTYQCKDTLVIYDDCGNECLAGGVNNTIPNSVSSNTWSTPTCGNGTQCQYGYSACLTNTLFSGGVTTSYACNEPGGIPPPGCTQ